MAPPMLLHHYIVLTKMLLFGELFTFPNIKVSVKIPNNSLELFTVCNKYIWFAASNWGHPLHTKGCGCVFMFIRSIFWTMIFKSQTEGPRATNRAKWNCFAGRKKEGHRPHLARRPHAANYRATALQYRRDQSVFILYCFDLPCWRWVGLPVSVCSWRRIRPAVVVCLVLILWTMV